MEELCSFRLKLEFSSSYGWHTFRPLDEILVLSILKTANLLANCISAAPARSRGCGARYSTELMRELFQERFFCRL